MRLEVHKKIHDCDNQASFCTSQKLQTIMKIIFVRLIFFLLPFNAYSFEIFALGTSNTNCKNAGQAYTNTLNELLSKEKIDAHVINAGVDGDKPIFMLNRIEQGLKAHPNIKIVLFEPGPNERRKDFNLESTEKILAYLKNKNMTSIYVSHSRVQNNEEAQALATKYGAFYYGHWNKDVPTDREHRQYDDGSAGHMTVAGCQLWAKNIFPLIQQVIQGKGIQ